MLVELAAVEQRYRAVLEVLEGAPVTEVARRFGVTRQTVHRWLRMYAAVGISGSWAVAPLASWTSLIAASATVRRSPSSASEPSNSP